MAMYANGNESPTLRTYVSDETKVSFLNVSTFKSAQVPWTYFFLSWTRNGQDQFHGKAGFGLETRLVKCILILKQNKFCDMLQF